MMLFSLLKIVRTRGDNAYHSVKIPGHGNERFSDEHVLFNAVERAERRKDSQLWWWTCIGLMRETITTGMGIFW